MSPCGWRPEAPGCLSCLPVFPIHLRILRSPVPDKPKNAPSICQTVSVMGAGISPTGPNSRNLQLDVTGLQGDRAETSKRDRKINPKRPRRVEPCMICRNLRAVVNLSLSLGWLSSFQPLHSAPHKGETRDEASPCPSLLRCQARRCVLPGSI